jgi:hypothetical protein
MTHADLHRAIADARDAYTAACDAVETARETHRVTGTDETLAALAAAVDARQTAYTHRAALTKALRQWSMYR